MVKIFETEFIKYKYDKILTIKLIFMFFYQKYHKQYSKTLVNMQEVSPNCNRDLFKMACAAFLHRLEVIKTNFLLGL